MGGMAGSGLDQAQNMMNAAQGMSGEQSQNMMNMAQGMMVQSGEQQ